MRRECPHNWKIRVMLTIQGHCSGYWNTVMSQSKIQLIGGPSEGYAPRALSLQ